MWIVKVALQRPFTFIVLAILILIKGLFAKSRTAVDIFPNIKIPVDAAIWRYDGLQPRDMADRVVLSAERTAQTSVYVIEHTEARARGGGAGGGEGGRPGAGGGRADS